MNPLFDQDAAIANALTRLHAAAAVWPELAYIAAQVPDARTLLNGDDRQFRLLTFDLLCFLAASMADVNDAELPLRDLFPEPPTYAAPHPPSPPMRPGQNLGTDRDRNVGANRPRTPSARFASMLGRFPSADELQRFEAATEIPREKGE